MKLGREKIFLRVQKGTRPQKEFKKKKIKKDWKNVWNLTLEDSLGGHSRNILYHLRSVKMSGKRISLPCHISTYVEVVYKDPL